MIIRAIAAFIVGLLGVFWGVTGDGTACVLGIFGMFLLLHKADEWEARER